MSILPNIVREKKAPDDSGKIVEGFVLIARCLVSAKNFNYDDGDFVSELSDDTRRFDRCF